MNGLRQSERRLHAEVEWSNERTAGEGILDGGCGAGRFLEVALRDECGIVGVDVSNAVDAAAETPGNRRNVHLVQASIFEIPFRDGAFDACCCIGVLQHTPDPYWALRALPRVFRDGGRICKGAELSTAACVACDERKAAVGNSGQKGVQRGG